MELVNQKPLSSVIFIPLACLVAIRPFFSGLAYPVFEFYYEIFIILLAVGVVAINPRRPGLNLAYGGYYCILLLISAYIISTITSINAANSLKETLKFISYISAFFIVSQAGNNQKKLLIKTIVICAFIISIYSIYQYFWGYQHTIDYLKRTQSDFLLSSPYAKGILIAKRAIGTFPSPNILGSYLLMMFFVSLTCMQRHSSSILPPIAITIALILTKSLGTWLSLITGLIILFFLSYASVKHKKVILILFVISIFIILSFIIITRWERLINIQNPQNSITQRFTYWRVASTIIKDHPLVGVGPGNFQNVFLKYKLIPGTNTRYAHNIFLHQWSETGVLGFMGIILLMITFFRKTYKKSRYIFLAGLAFLIHNLIDNSYFIPEVGLFWWVLCGLP